MSAPTTSPRGERWLRVGPWSARLRHRVLGATLALLAVLGLLAVAGMMIGDLDLSAGQVLQSLLGRGDALTDYFVQEQRAPRVAAAVVIGAGLGVAGALFQGITGNPLGSPDVLGFTTGAATGALVQIIVFDADSTAVALGALAGGLLTALAVHLTTRSAGLTGARLVLVGLGFGALLGALNTLLVEKADLGAAQTAGSWLAGSLNGIGWSRTLLTAAVVLVLLVAALALSRAWQLLSLGDDLAHSLGVPVARVRGLCLLVAVVLVSVTTAAAGPLAFVALAAPQISRRLAGTAVPGICGAALTGAVVVLGSDLLAQRLLAPTQLNVGVVTGALGGVYLIALLALDWKRFRP